MSIETWGYTIKKLRESKDYTQQDVADKSGLSRSLIARIEQGSIITPTPDTINALAPVFDMRPAKLSAFLYGDTTIPKASDTDIIFELISVLRFCPFPFAVI